MKAFEGVETINATKKECAPIMCRRKLHIFSLFFVVCLSFSCLGIGASHSSLSREIKNITAYWSPNLADLGKLKYVGKESEEVMATVSEFAMPFKNSLVTQLAAGEFEINGLGSLVVKACLGGIVESIEQDGISRAITIAHGKNLKTVYSNIDIVGVKKGDSVNKNSPLGISNSSNITFKVLYKNKLLAGLTIVNGEFSFL